MDRLEGLSEKIFLDRYALKHEDASGVAVGDIVLALVKEDPKFPVKEVGEVVERRGDCVKVKLVSGEMLDATIASLMHPVETAPNDMWNRLAGAVASVEGSEAKSEEWRAKFKETLRDWKLVPGGRIAAGAGASDELTLFNCYVIPSPKDSRGGIMESLADMTEIMARGGGVGLNLSSLRPRRAVVSGVNGTSSGSVSWGGLFSYTTGLIEQGGSRRGALMLMLNDWHPDLLSFITVKQTMGEVTNANLSVCVSDDFMEVVQQDGDWELVFPDTKEDGYDELWNGDLAAWKALGKRVKTYAVVKAREIWHTLIQSAWKSAEPGVVFMERYNKLSNSWYFNPVISTNPCLHKDTRIATEYGLITISELYRKVGRHSLRLITDNRLTEQAAVVNGRTYELGGTSVRHGRVLYTGVKNTIHIELANGMEIKVTPEHRIYTDKGWMEAQRLTREDSVYIQSGAGLFPETDELGADWGMFLGWLIGDGWISKRGDIGMVFGKEDAEVIPAMIQAGQKFSGARAKLFHRSNGTMQVYWWRKAFREKLTALGVKAVPAHEKEVPEALFTAKKETVTAFIQTLFSADGTVYDKDDMHRTVRLTSTSNKLLKGVQLLLLNYGIHGRIYFRGKKNQRKFHYETVAGEKREYEGQPVYELILSGNNIAVFKEQIGFRFISRKQEALERIARPSRKGEKFISKVVSISEGEKTEVYDIQEPLTNSLIANGLVVHNCGEQGLPGWGVCNLSAVNLSCFYDGETQDVAWDELAGVTRSAVRFLDNVIDLTPYHFPQNEQNQKNERRIGLGTMGLAELLIKLAIPYGSPESLRFLDRLYGFMTKEAYLASSELAAEKGSFPAFDAELYLQSGFMQQLVDAYPEVGESILRNGMRNVTVITQAPTGSTGTMVGTSTGIEPYFAFHYYRKSRLGYDQQLVPIAQQWKDEHPGEELPDYFVSAMELSAEDHIRVQATIQRWVDSSISKTANCPADFTVEDTKRLYELAYELGCKGVTIYRDGSRSEQVLSASESKEETTEKTGGEEAAKESGEGTDHGQVPNADRGDGISGETGNEPITTQQETTPARNSMLSDINRNAGTDSGNKPYRRRPQVLRGATYKLNTPFGMAYITINDLSGSPGEVFLNVGKAGSDVFAMAEALGRVCSLFLRYGDHGSKVDLLIKHLKGIGGTGASGFGNNRVESIADAVAKALEMHVAEIGRSDSPAGYEADAARGSVSQSGYPQDDYPQGSDLNQPLLQHDLEARHLGTVQTGLGERDLCPSCGSAALINIEGCKQCTVCGFSKCN